MRPFLFISLLLALLTGACGVPSGTFALKGRHDDQYRKLRGALEIEEGDTREWLYRFNSAPDPMAIGVIYMKKEVVWVDILTVTEKMDGRKNLIRGEIKDLAPGEYRLLLTDVTKRNEIIATLDFIIYAKEEEEDDTGEEERIVEY